MGQGLQRRQCLVQAGAWGLLSAATPTMAQFRVEVSGLGAAQLPIALPALRGEAGAPHKISAIVRADLERSGIFRSVDATGVNADETSSLNASVWRQRGADFAVAGSILPLANGTYDVRFRLWDVVRSTDLGGQSFAVAPGEMRLWAHRMADFIYEKLTGDKGIFATRIAYVTRTAQRYNLWLADSDGEGAQSAFASPEPFISPSWSPNGTSLAYVSFESRKPVIYSQEVATGRRRLLANFRGSNSAPAWTADGRQVVATLSRDGGSQIYVMDAAGGGEPRRLTQSSSIDTEPTCSSDGRWIYFVSDRGGSPQIYRMPTAGGSADRVTFTGNYNISPAISPDAKSMAFIARVGGAYKLHLMDLASSALTALTDTAADESPSFSPNGRMILYATQQQGREALMTTTVDGRIKARLAGQSGDIREPDWGPFAR
ncbi:MAG: Tol-Pal system beta propeller repeat protein TolB [Betaproteobacteria bacterium]